MEKGSDFIERIANLLLAELFDSDEPRNFEARIIAEYISGNTYSELIVSGVELNKNQQQLLESVITKRNSGIPLAYVINSVTFRDLDLFVDERVLIPRSETEIVVQYAIDLLKKLNQQVQVLDIGTGSGAISLTIAHECKHVNVIATDISSEALEVARLNGIGSGSCASRVGYLQSDLYNSIPEDLHNSFDLIISNPPYIGLDETADVQDSVLDYEPHIALFSGDTGEMHYRTIVEQSSKWLKADGTIIFEISPRHVDLMNELTTKNNFTSCEIYPDLTGIERVCILKN